MKTLYCADSTTTNTLQQLIVAEFTNTAVTLQSIAPKNEPMYLVEDGLILNDPNAISYHIATGSRLLGQEVLEQIDAYSWLEYFNIQIHPLLQELYGQIFGTSQADEKKYSYALEEFRKTLKVLDDQLKIKTFLVSDRILLTDVILCCQLDKAFRLIVNIDTRKKLANLTRWFRYIRETGPFVKKLGKLFLCQAKAFEPVFPKPEPQEEKKEKAEEKEEKKQENPGQMNEKKQEEKDAGWNIENFKREFQNTEQKQKVITNLMNNFPEGWSLWKIHYSKDVTEGKVDFLTSNLCNGTLQRLEGLRKTGFGTFGVYYNSENSEYEIRGVMMWKGVQIAEAWKNHPSFEYHIFTKLNPVETEDSSLVMDYWMNKETAEGLSLYASNKLI